MDQEAEIAATVVTVEMTVMAVMNVTETAAMVEMVVVAETSEIATGIGQLGALRRTQHDV